MPILPPKSINYPILNLSFGNILKTEKLIKNLCRKSYRKLIFLIKKNKKTLLKLFRFLIIWALIFSLKLRKNSMVIFSSKLSILAKISLTKSLNNSLLKWKKMSMLPTKLSFYKMKMIINFTL